MTKLRRLTRRNKNKGKKTKYVGGGKEYSEGFIRRMSEPLHFEIIPTTPEERVASKLEFEKEKKEYDKICRDKYLKDIHREDLIGKMSIIERLEQKTKQLHDEFNFYL